MTQIRRFHSAAMKRERLASAMELLVVSAAKSPEGTKNLLAQLQKKQH